MTSERREVRATLEFFQDLDRQLPDERGPSGEPSTNDFQTFELLEIVERFAREIRPQLHAAALQIAPLLILDDEHRVPLALWERLRAQLSA